MFKTISSKGNEATIITCDKSGCILSGCLESCMNEGRHLNKPGVYLGTRKDGDKDVCI